MDKNTLIGFLLIGVVLFAFSWFNRPTPEQLEAQRRYQDSIAKIEYAQQLELQKQENKSALVEDSLENVPDSVRAQRLQQSFGVFGEAMVGTEDYTTLQNNLVELRISNKGGRICYARLKEYDTYNDEPLVLFDEKESNFNFTLVTATNRTCSSRSRSDPQTYVLFPVGGYPAPTINPRHSCSVPRHRSIPYPESGIAPYNHPVSRYR